ncbi:pentatricopeptide repeat-containing protein At2g02980, chloroplastic-like [Castanea sativa]|uniref:pentatricopeptide repeat-containing protein At2g02980, chloroplastic-like n=1 Tax=Castanea sativa TaxID=21020 RepID=UPI003F6492A6
MTSLLLLPLRTMPTNCSTKFSNQTLWSSTPWPVNTPAKMPLFRPFCSFLISYALALSRASSKALQEVITGYARSSRPNEAFSLFCELQPSDFKPTDVTLLSTLSSCALLGALDLGRWIHEYVKMHGFDKYVKVKTALIDMYAKCGRLDDGMMQFANMSARDTQAWSAMVMAYATHGHGSKAISLFEETKRARVRPDEITFLGLLKACSHTG